MLFHKEFQVRLDCTIKPCLKNTDFEAGYDEDNIVFMQEIVKEFKKQEKDQNQAKVKNQ